MAKVLSKFFLFIIVPILLNLFLAPWTLGLNENLNQSFLSSIAPKLNQSLFQESSFSTSTNLNYHGGLLLTGPNSINIYLIWYGAVYLKDRTSITDFFNSLSFRTSASHREPTVLAWWSTVLSYKDKSHNSVSGTVKLVKQIGDIKYSLGKNIRRAQIASYVKNKIDNKVLPLDSKGIYLFLTSRDVIVEKFCMGNCGFHDSIMVSSTQKVVYAHVGDPSVQCPGLCAWPFAIPAYGPPGQALVAPNGVGADGMVMNIATVIAGAATNPFQTGYFQGDPLAPLEAVTACPGIFGAGAYPGYPGDLIVDQVTKASYNAFGTNGRKFLLPAIWDPLSTNCKVVA